MAAESERRYEIILLAISGPGGAACADHEDALAEFDRMIALDPNFAQGRMARGTNGSQLVHRLATVEQLADFL
jgi:hypothetical protein